MRYTTIILPLALAALVMTAFSVGSAFAQQTSGASPVLASTSNGDSVIGGGSSVPSRLVRRGHGGFRSGLWFGGGYPGYYRGYSGGYYGGYPSEIITEPTQTCVWTGYQYNCYNFPRERIYVY